jgi:hypothetical protein
MARTVAFKARPPVKSAEELADEQERIERFVAGADVKRGDKHASEAPQAPTLPEPMRRPVRKGVAAAPLAGDPLDFFALPDDRRNSIMNLRLTDREKGALLFIQANTPPSMHAFCLKAVQDAINTTLEKLVGRTL